MASVTQETKTITEHTLVLSDQEARELMEVLGNSTGSEAYSVYTALLAHFGMSDF